MSDVHLELLPERPAVPVTLLSAAPSPGRPRPEFTSALLLLSDMAVLLLTGSVAAIVWSLINPAVNSELFLALWPLVGLFLLGYASVGLYPAAGIGPVEEFQRLSHITTAVYLVASLVLFLAGRVMGQSRGIFLLSLGLALLFVPLGRALVRHLFASSSWWGVPVLVLGAGKTGKLLIERINSNPGLNLKILACLDDDTSKLSSFDNVSVVGTCDNAPSLARKLHIRHALIAMPGLNSTELSRLVKRYAAVFPNLYFIPELFGMMSLGLAAHDLGGIIGLRATQNLLLPLNRWLKRILDGLLLIPLVVVAAPLILFAALLIMLTSPGNPFYAQKREGYRGKVIHVWKLRTMYPNAETLLSAYLRDHPEAQEEWSSFYKLRQDPRILPGIGHFLRKTSLDELPQIWNIFVGEMSFVGPRPFPTYHLEGFDEEFRSLRNSVQPGLTGLWQVSNRSDGDLKIQKELDSYYIKNWSLWLDLYLLARTPWSVFFGKGAY